MKTRPKIVSAGEWRAALLQGQSLGCSKQKADAAQVDGAGLVSFIMSDDSVDRMGDVIKQDGWSLDAFKKNPVLLWAHDYTLPPVGKIGACVIEDGKLKAKSVVFVDREVSPFAWSVGEMYRKGFLNAVSVGFAPQEFAPCETGFEFRRQELLELSAVPVPANANALIEARGAGLFVPEWRGWAEKILDTSKQRPADEAALAMAIYRALPAATKSPLAGPDDSEDIAVNPEEPMAESELPEVAALVDALKAHGELLAANTAALVALASSSAPKAAPVDEVKPDDATPKAFDADAIARRVSAILTQGE